MEILFTMYDLEQELHRLAKPDPSREFVHSAKERILHQIRIQETEKGFLKFLSRFSIVSPSPQFMQLARVRLLSRIQSFRQPVFGGLLFFKRALASILVMALAVTTTLFYADGRQPVNASESTTLQILAGEVTLKHADQLIWDPVTSGAELSAGDLVRVGPGGLAVIRFFDDNQLRLSENSMILISRLATSPGYSHQGIIEVSLHQGTAWAQVMNVDDGFASFALTTPHALLSARNASFDVTANPFEPTLLHVYKNSVDVSVLKPDSRVAAVSGKVGAFQQVILDTPSAHPGTTILAAYAPITDVSSSLRDSAWVQQNFKADLDHLNALREQELSRLKASTGALPGEWLYPIKRAQERLALALTFDPKNQADARVQMANERLNEAVILLEKNQAEQAKSVLVEYQDLVKAIADQGVNTPLLPKLVLASRPKTLTAALPADPRIALAKQALDETEELFAQDQAKKAEVRLQNSSDEFGHIYDYVTAGQLDSVEKLLADRSGLYDSMLTEASTIADPQQKKALYNQILDTQQNEKRVLRAISSSLALRNVDSRLIASVENARQGLAADIRQTAEALHPLAPEAALSNALASRGEKLNEFVAKINIYKTLQGQKNQVKRLLSQYPEYQRDANFLAQLRDRLEGTAKVVVQSRISDLQYQRMLKREKMKKGK